MTEDEMCKRINELQDAARRGMERCRNEIDAKMREYRGFAQSATDPEHVTHSRNKPHDSLHNILWQGRQWAVTQFGVEKLDGSYYLSRSVIDDDPFILCHVAKKAWCDVADFAEAYMRARVLYAESPEEALVPKRFTRPSRSSDIAWIDPTTWAGKAVP